MENFLLIAMLVVAVLIVIAVLLQKSSSMGLGAYSGSNESVFGARGPASFLAKSTFILGFTFVVLAIMLGMEFNKLKDASVTDGVKVEANATIPTAPAAPTAPVAPATTK